MFDLLPALEDVGEQDRHPAVIMQPPVVCSVQTISAAHHAPDVDVASPLLVLELPHVGCDVPRLGAAEHQDVDRLAQLAHLPRVLVRQ